MRISGRPWRCASLLVPLFLAGCMFGDLRQNLAQMDQYSVLRGTVRADHATDLPIIVVIYSGEKGREQLVDYFVQAGPGPYFFFVPAGDYRLAAFEDASGRSKGRPVLAGGKSLGGRIASMCVADGMPAAGLVFLGYPLHPPGKVDRVRAEHLSRIEVPMLLLQGTRDPFAQPERLEGVLAGLGDRATLVPIEGGDHSFRVRGHKADDHSTGAALAGTAAAWIRDVVG